MNYEIERSTTFRMVDHVANEDLNVADIQRFMDDYQDWEFDSEASTRNVACGRSLFTKTVDGKRNTIMIVEVFDTGKETISINLFDDDAEQFIGYFDLD